MKEIIQRLLAKTPEFWKRVQIVMLALGAVGGIVVINPILYPVFIQTIAPHLMTAGLVGTFLSQLTKD